jgi:hypothetical protein
VRATLETISLLCLERRIRPGIRGYATPEAARELLVDETGVDFGSDVDAWRKYLTEHDLLDEGYVPPTMSAT